jgi:hypothetical protein
VRVRNVLALVGVALLATIASLALRSWLFGSVGLVVWLLCDLVVYSGAALLLLRSRVSLRQFRWVVAFGVAGAILKFGLSAWVLLDSEMLRLLREESSLRDAWPVLLMLLPGVLFEVLAPIAGALLGWLMWRPSSRIASSGTA